MPNKVEFNSEYPKVTESQKLLERARGLIPAFTQTLGKGPTQHVQGVCPVYLKRGKGSHVWDVDGNEYLDYTMAYGPLSLGYAYPKVDEAIRRQLEDGITFTLMHPLEVEAAELLREVLPNAESVRFSKTGADATTAAVRVSRAFTGREKVLCCGYHGWHDWYVGVTDRNQGVQKSVQDSTFTFNYNDLEGFAQSIDSDTACVIMEPFVFEEPKPGFLEEVQKICKKNGTLLIFDEMWTGFRMAVGGAQEYYGIKPDLATYSKAMANGMPISAIVGRQDVMSLFNEKIWFFTTFGGEALSLAATIATITELKEKNVPAYLRQLGDRLKKGYSEIAERNKMTFTKCVGQGYRSLVTFDASAGNPLELKSLMQQELIKRGILWTGFHTMSFSHTEQEVDYTLSVYEEVMPLIKQAVENRNVRALLRGEPVSPVFRKIGNFNTKPKT